MFIYLFIYYYFSGTSSLIFLALWSVNLWFTGPKTSYEGNNQVVSEGGFNYRGGIIRLLVSGFS